MRYWIVIFVFMFGFTSTDARKANEAYRNGEYEVAADLYRSAIQADPENPRLYFNLGNTLSKLGNTEEAIQAYEQFKSMTDTPEEQSLADYNIGNLYSENEDMQRAAEYYRRSLQNNPDDADAKYNYELAMKQQQDQEQEQNSQQNQDQEQDQDEENQEQEQNQNSDQNQDQEQENQNQDQDQQQDPDNQSQNEQQQQPRMSPEEAESILDALAQRERELLRDLKKESETESSSNDKDW